MTDKKAIKKLIGQNNYRAGPAQYLFEQNKEEDLLSSSSSLLRVTQKKC